MSNNPSDPFSMQPDDEQQASQPRPGSTPAPETNPDQDTGDSLHEIRQQLRSSAPKPSEKKRGFFARLFGSGKEKEAPEPVVEKPSKPLPPAAFGQLGDADEDHVIKTGENEYDVYHGYEQYQTYDYEELSEKENPTENPEPAEGLAGLEALTDSNTNDTTKLTKDASRPAGGSEEKVHNPEWRDFLSHFLKTKDEEEEAKKYVVTDDVVENRLVGAMADADDDEEWQRLSRKDKDAKRPAVLPTLPGEEPKIDETWLAELRGEGGQPSPKDAAPAASSDELEDWLSESDESQDQILKNRLQPSSPVQMPPAEAPEDEDSLANRFAFLTSQESDKSAGEPKNPSSPLEFTGEDLFFQDHPESLPSDQEPSEPVPGSSPHKLFFEEDEPPAVNPSEDDWSELRNATTYSYPPLDMPIDMGAADNYSEMHPELFDPARLGDAPAGSEAEPASPQKAGPRSDVLREAQSAGVEGHSAEIRSTALEGYAVPEGPVEVYQPSTGKSPVEQAANWLSTRSIAAQILLGIVFLALIAALVGIPMFFIQRAALIRSQVVIQPTPVSFSGIPYPTGLRITGGWYFNLAPATLKDGKWEPQGSEWLEGTEIRRVVGVPWSRQSEAVANSLRAGDKIEMQMSNGDLVEYLVSTVQQVPVEDTSIFDGRNPSLAVILFQQSTANRWVIIADLKQ